jgi:hypothetical protein
MTAVPAFTLPQLGDLVAHAPAADALASLRAAGATIDCPDSGWRPLSGGLEYSSCTGGVVRVEGVDTQLSIELLRPQPGASFPPPEQARQVWLSAIELQPPGGDFDAWVAGMRAALQRSFALASKEPTGAEKWSRNGRQGALLLPAQGSAPPRLLLQRLSETRQPG